MDYSLLFTIAFNPDYVKKHPDHFERVLNFDGSEGDFVKPYKLKEIYTDKVEDRRKKLAEHDEEKQLENEIERRNTIKVFANTNNVEEEFLIFMSGWTREELEEDNKARAIGNKNSTADVKPYSFEKF